MDWFRSVLLWSSSKKVFKKILLGSLTFELFSLAVPLIAFAQPASTTCPDGQIMSDLGCIPDDPIGFVEHFYGWGLGLIGFVAILFMIIGGYYLMTSQGDQFRLAK